METSNIDQYIQFNIMQVYFAIGCCHNLEGPYQQILGVGYREQNIITRAKNAWGFNSCGEQVPHFR